MNISVWDTYVKRENTEIMHFDILIENTTTNKDLVLNYGKIYLKEKPFNTEDITTEACKFCHIEEATESIMRDIKQKGFSIIEMENCN